LQQLLREQVSIRDLATILETLLDLAPINKNPVLLVESARQAGAGAGASAAFGKRKPARGHARSRAGRRARPRLRRARAARDKYNRPAASVCPPHSRRPAPSGRRAGGPGESSAALRHAGTLSPEAVARTFPAQGGGSFAHGGASRDRNSIAGGFALRRF